MLLVMMSLLIFGAVSAAAFAIQRTSAADKNPVAVRLRELRAAHISGPSLMNARRPPLLLKLIAQLGGFLPLSKWQGRRRPAIRKFTCRTSRTRTPKS